MIKLSPRLQSVADLIPPCAYYADIGTDHAYLPVYLIQTKKVKFALACDVRQGPLDNAAKTVRKYGLENQITLRLSDGLNRVTAQEAEVVSIAGMGGELMSEIVQSASWLQDCNKQVVLQPMTHFEAVRRMLCENGFEITHETTACEGKHIYLSLSAQYSGKTQEYAPWYYYTGRLIYSKADADRAFCKRVIDGLQAKADARRNVGLPSLDTERIIKELKNEQSK